MFKKLKCWLFGHHFICYKSDYYSYDGSVSYRIDKYVCLRCGKKYTEQIDY